MEIKDNVVYLTNEELELVKRAKIISWNAPEAFLKNWCTKLNESYDLAYYKKVIALCNANNYKITN